MSYTINGTTQRLHLIQIDFDGPSVNESPATFRDFRLDVIFTSPSGSQTRVPGFWNADGSPAESSADSGDIWSVRFAPKELGVYSFVAEFKVGNLEAIGIGGASGGFMDGDTGNFTITETTKAFPDYRGRGVQEYTGKWNPIESITQKAVLKSGLDSPENVFDHPDFDNTYDTGGNSTPGLVNGLHSFSATDGFIPAGSPTWQGGKGASLFGLLGYLQSVNINSIYGVMFGTEGGDGGATWPWVDPNGAKDVYDVSKLDQWHRVIKFANELGIQWHYVIQETENDTQLPNDELQIYVREICARFGHNLAVKWNIGEEPTDLNDSKKALIASWFGQYLQHTHNVAFHTAYQAGPGVYNGLKNNPDIHGTSFQGHYDQANNWAHAIRTQGGKPRIIEFDEQSPELQQAGGAGNRKQLRNLWWWNVTGGGNGWEVYYGGNSNDWGDQALDSVNQTPSHLMLEQLGRFWRFYYDNNIPVSGMVPDLTHGMISGGGGQGNTLHYKTGSSYVAYLPNGGTQTLDLGQEAGKTFNIKWFDPRNGGVSNGSISAVSGGSTVSLGSPPSSTSEDWVVWVQNQENQGGGGCNGTVDCNQVDYVDDGSGKIVIHAENMGINGQWQLNAHGSLPPAANYVTWNKGGANSIGTPADPMSATFAVCADGNFEVSVFSYIDPDQGDITEGNDYYLRVQTPTPQQWKGVHSTNQSSPDIYPAGSGLTPNPNGDPGVDKYFKGFHNNGGQWSKLTQISEGNGQWEYRPTVVAKAGEIYTLDLAGRSYGLSADLIVIWDKAKYTYSQIVQSLSETLCNASGNSAPIVSNVPNQTTAQNSSANVQVSASDPDGDTLTYAATGLPSGLSINANTGLISGTVVAAPGPYQVTVTVTDDGSPNLSSQVSFTWTVTQSGSNNPPVIQNIADQQNEQQDTASLQVVASDPDGDNLLYSATGLPSGLSINPNTGLISGEIIASPGPYIVRVTVADDGTPQQSAQKSFIWTVTQGQGNPTDGFYLEYSLDCGQTWTKQQAGFNDHQSNQAQAVNCSIQRRVCTVLSDGTICCDTAEVIIYEPVVSDGSFETDKNQQKTFDLSSISSDPLGGSLTYSTFTGVNNGTLSISGSIATYTPSTDYVGADQFTLRATNQRGDVSDLFTVDINVKDDEQQSAAVVEITGISDNGVPWSVTMCQADTATQLNCDQFRIRVERAGNQVWFSWPNFNFSGCNTQQMEYGPGGGTYGDSGADVVAQSGDVIILEGTVDGWQTFSSDTYTVP